MELSEKAAYLKGLIEGLGIDDSTKEGKVIRVMSEILMEMTTVVQEIDDDVSQLYDDVDEIAEELELLEDDLYEDEDEEGEDGDVEGEYEITCTKCGAINLADEEVLLGEEEIFCANCHEKLDIGFDEQ